MHIICAIQESVLNFQMKDLLFFSHDSFSPSSPLSYAGMYAHTQLVSRFCFMSCSPIPLLLFLCPWKALIRKVIFVFTNLKSCYCPDQGKCYWSKILSLSLEGISVDRSVEIPAADKDARAGPTSSSPEESACQSGDTEGSHSKWMLTNIELENASLFSLVFNIAWETSSCLMNVIGC